jgi:hypothetical protein
MVCEGQRSNALAAERGDKGLSTVKPGELFSSCVFSRTLPCGECSTHTVNGHASAAAWAACTHDWLAFSKKVLF